jgi:hypothetical protein
MRHAPLGVVKAATREFEDTREKRAGTREGKTEGIEIDDLFNIMRSPYIHI